MFIGFTASLMRGIPILEARRWLRFMAMRLHSKYPAARLPSATAIKIMFQKLECPEKRSRRTFDIEESFGALDQPFEMVLGIMQ